MSSSALLDGQFDDSSSAILNFDAHVPEEPLKPSDAPRLTKALLLACIMSMTFGSTFYTLLSVHASLFSLFLRSPDLSLAQATGFSTFPVPLRLS